LMKAQCYAGKGMFGIASRILNTLEMQWQNDRSHLLHLPASITCLRLRMDPTGPEAERLMDCWETFRQNPSSGSESAILYVRFLEAALQTRNKILIAPVVWQGVNMLSLPDYGTEMRRLMQLALEAWTRYPELELANHWLHYLTRLASPMAEQDFHLIFQYLKFFSTTGKAPLTDATLSRVQLTGINR